MGAQPQSSPLAHRQTVGRAGVADEDHGPSGEGSRVSINPPSDLLLDVARAADPAKSSAAAERLARIAANDGAGDEDFSDVLDGVETSSPAPSGAALPPDPSAIKLAKLDNAPKDAELKAYQGIEALVLQNLVETMLPDSEEFFGAEAGAGIWKSMLAQELGTDLSKRVDLGIGPKHLGRETHSHRRSEFAASLAPVGDVNAKHS
jgi:flagellar protein FlgJ